MTDQYEESMSIAYYLSIVVLTAAPMIVVAQTQSPVDPAEVAAAVMPQEYKSAFQDYRPMVDAGEAPWQNWRAANDEVGRIGGHAGYMPSAQDADANTAAPKDVSAEWLPYTPHSEHSGHHGGHH
jgi:hypothetical protein